MSRKVRSKREHTFLVGTCSLLLVIILFLVAVFTRPTAKKISYYVVDYYEEMMETSVVIQNAKTLLSEVYKTAENALETVNRILLEEDWWGSLLEAAEEWMKDNLNIS